MVYDRNNSGTFRLTGNGATDLSGTIYLNRGNLEMNGNGCSEIDALVVVGDLSMAATRRA